LVPASAHTIWRFEQTDVLAVESIKVPRDDCDLKLWKAQDARTPVVKKHMQ